MIKRIISASLLIPVFVAALLWLPTSLLVFLVSGLVLLAAWEWARLMGLPERWTVFTAMACSFGIGVLVLVYFAPLQLLLFVATCFWLAALFFEKIFPSGAWVFKSRYLMFGLGILLLASTSATLLFVHQLNPVLVLFVCAVVWASDIGAYFAGKALGRHRLAPHLSPKKTWEGVVGGVALSLLVGCIFHFWWLSEWPALTFYAVLLAVVAFGIVGDLMVSLLKRIRGLKDTGYLIPGHGGILDRIDSLLAAFPIFGFLYTLLFNL